ncbi:MAG TPA: DUF2975 domain-containing protein [Candidatus Limivivens merdigallinarum]|uniref:DUF2975 domain-containing protein n=1 Tax=Candidatus Limivivens merdigallinarum TaxID=2840859 RepID=A0A9D1D184_9FIRM|nr:DUF2975 domain-containing protein [Candidatus Limivivens merdigallinarum]
MEDKKMRDCSREIVKAQCETIGRLMRILFWGYGIFVVGAAAMGIWISSQASDLFAVSLANTGSGLAGYALFRGGMTVSFPQGVLNSAASLVPKLTYLIGYFVGILGHLVVWGMLLQLRTIFRNIDFHETPFSLDNCRALFRMGILIIVFGIVRGSVLRVLCSFWKIGGSGGSPADFALIIVGAVVISISYIFEYGTALQKESDETL